MVKGVYPVIMSGNIREKSNFFVRYFGFEEAYLSDWYISLRSESGCELAFINKNLENIPEKYQADCKGIILNIEVNNVDEIYSDLKRNPDLNFIFELANESLGQRHFIVEAYGEILVDVIEMLTPEEEIAKEYSYNQDNQNNVVKRF